MTDDTKKDAIPAEEQGKILAKNGLRIRKGVSSELLVLSEALNALVPAGGDPERTIEEMEKMITLDDQQKADIRARNDTGAIGINSENRNSFKFVATSFKTVARILGEMEK